MNHKNIPLQLSLLVFLLCIPSFLKSQGLGGSNIHGNFQFDGQFYRSDSATGAKEVPEKFLNNAFANFNYELNNFSAGLRYENYLNPLLTFEEYKGQGITFRYLTYNNENLEITVGNYYEQFGSGLVFRSYEERALGIDNAMDGIRIRYKPSPGIYLKGILGKERNFFSVGEGIVRGVDGEISMNETFKGWNDSKTKVIVGASFVSKYQPDENSVYILPENVGCTSGRINLQNGAWNLNTEYAYKINDPYPSEDIYYKDYYNFNYKNGEALLVSLAYTVKGFGATLAAKRIDNMNFRTDRDATKNSLYINYLPALTKNHTNILPAIYPYASQRNGEMALQAEVFFNLKPQSKWGGKYGTDVNLNYSRAQDIDREPAEGDMVYTSSFLKTGEELFFEDFNLEISRKWSKEVRTTLSYVYLNYNKDRIESTDGYGHVYSHSAILETIWKLSAKRTLRSEIQHLYTKQDQQSWALLLLEYTIAPKWSIAAFDQYNYGNDLSENRLHYYTGTIAFTKNANRFSIGYGRQRKGIICVGGVCRSVPASSGITFSVTSSF